MHVRLPLLSRLSLVCSHAPLLRMHALGDFELSAGCAKAYTNITDEDDLDDFDSPTPESLQCLVDNHRDAVFGGNSQPDLWDEIAPQDSAAGRLADLLQYLVDKFPSQGWERFIDVSTGDLKWENIWMMGHSQSASHVAFMAATLPLRGAGLFAGPQDKACVSSDDCWINQNWTTTNIRGIVHVDEPNYDRITNNWLSAGVLAKPGVRVHDGSAQLPTGRIWIATATPAMLDTGCTPSHCSLAIDTITPVGRDGVGGVNPMLYSRGLWQQMAGLSAPVPVPAPTMAPAPSPADPNTTTSDSKNPINSFQSTMLLATLLFSTLLTMW